MTMKKKWSHRRDLEIGRSDQSPVQSHIEGPSGTWISLNHKIIHCVACSLTCITALLEYYLSKKEHCGKGEKVSRQIRMGLMCCFFNSFRDKAWSVAAARTLAVFVDVMRTHSPRISQTRSYTGMLPDGLFDCIQILFRDCMTYHSDWFIRQFSCACVKIAIQTYALASYCFTSFCALY